MKGKTWNQFLEDSGWDFFGSSQQRQEIVAENCSMRERKYRMLQRADTLLGRTNKAHKESNMFKFTQDHAKECGFYFNRWTQCISQYDYQNDAPECQQYTFDFRDSCPKKWITYWNGTRETGLYMGLGNKAGGIPGSEDFS